MRAVRWPIQITTLVCLIGCLGDPAGPGGVLVVRRLGTADDSVLVGAPGRPLAPIAFQAVDGEGQAIIGAAVRWAVAGANARVEQAAGATDSRGQFTAVSVLGT